MNYVLAQYRWDGERVSPSIPHRDVEGILAQLPPIEDGGTASPRSCMKHCLERPHNSRMLAWVSVSKWQADQGLLKGDNKYLLPLVGYFVVYTEDTVPPAHLFRDNLDAEVYIADLRANYDRFHTWRGDRTMHDPKDVPAGIYSPDANDVGKLEIWSWFQPDFYMDTRPYTAYVHKSKLNEPGWGYVTGWAGEVIGRIDYMTTETYGGFNSRYRMVYMTDWNGKKWYGRWYERTQDCVNLRLKKEQK